jgi:hypothetical protein
VAGFCTLSSSNVPLNEAPEPLAKKPPRHPTVRIMGSKSELLCTLVAASGGKPGAAGVQRSVLKWRAVAGEDENYVYAIAL